MYTTQTTATAQGFLASLLILTFGLDNGHLGNFRVAKLECVNYFRVQWVKWCYDKHLSSKLLTLMWSCFNYWKE